MTNYVCTTSDAGGPYVCVEIRDGEGSREFTDPTELTAIARELDQADEWLTREQMFGPQS